MRAPGSVSAGIPLMVARADRETVMSSEAFRAGHTYDNVYFLFADASGYSSAVASTPLDHAAHAFNLLRDRLIALVRTLASERGCARTAVWGWRGTADSSPSMTTMKAPPVMLRWRLADPCLPSNCRACGMNWTGSG